MPKYIGPYHIVRDFGNNSFKLDILARLKQRGVHDVFHASLLKLHVPNDDCLFPGRLEHQVTEFDDAEQEWAVDKFIGHSSSGKQSTFEVLWKSGDITWMPFDSVTHLDALHAYFEALGIMRIEELGPGKSKPPMNDPQVFLASMEWEEQSELSYLTAALDNFSLGSASSPPIPIIMSNTLAINPNLTIVICTSPTLFTINYHGFHATYSAHQVHLFVQYDAALRAGRRNTAKPGGYDNFIVRFNQEPNVSARFTTFLDNVCTIGSNVPNHLILPTVTLDDSAGNQSSKSSSSAAVSARIDAENSLVFWAFAVGQAKKKDFDARKKEECLANKGGDKPSFGRKKHVRTTYEEETYFRRPNDIPWESPSVAGSTSGQRSFKPCNVPDATFALDDAFSVRSPTHSIPTNDIIRGLSMRTGRAIESTPTPSAIAEDPVAREHNAADNQVTADDNEMDIVASPTGSHAPSPVPSV